MAKAQKKRQPVRVPVTGTSDLNRPISVRGTPKTTWLTRTAYFDALRKVSRPLRPEKESS